MAVAFDRKSAERIGDVVRRVEAMPTGDYPRRSRHKSRFTAGSEYMGPWAVVEKDTATVTVKAYDLTNGYVCRSLLIAGLTTQTHSADADVTITTSGAVYAKITFAGGVYVFEFVNAAALPEQAAGILYVALAYVTFADSAITTLQQAQYGQIHVAGRIV